MVQGPFIANIVMVLRVVVTTPSHLVGSNSVPEGGGGVLSLEKGTNCGQTATARAVVTQDG